jgi:hypothetical protein
MKKAREVRSVEHGTWMVPDTILSMAREISGREGIQFHPPVKGVQTRMKGLEIEGLEVEAEQEEANMEVYPD